MPNRPVVKPLGPHALRGRYVALEPLATDHRDGLRALFEDEDLWRYIPVRADGAHFDPVWNMTQTEINHGQRIAYVVRRLSDSKIVGTTSYLAITPQHGRVEIGWTIYARDVQGSTVNPEAKLLLFTNAFETAGYHRVELKTDSTNTRSRAAILKLGAKEEGTLREHMWMPRNYWRDTVYYSVLRDEWPTVKEKLEARLG